MSEPRTEAGRALLDSFVINHRDAYGEVMGHITRADIPLAILAIEDEAAAALVARTAALEAALERIVEGTDDLWARNTADDALAPQEPGQ